MTFATIPGSVTSIGNVAFDGCDSLVSVTSLIEEPFNIESSVFSENTIDKGTLYVPAGTLKKYKSSLGWKEFMHIEEAGASTGAGNIKAEDVMIQSDNGVLHISGVAEGTRVVVYSLTGAKVASMNVTGNTTTIPTPLRKGDVAIVRIGGTAMKVMMQ